MSLDYIEPDDFKLIQGSEYLSIYQWGDKDVNHYFCSTCGIYPFHDSIYEPGKYRVNLCSVDELDVRSLELNQFNGKERL